jgi:hypothetical protein
MSGLNQHGNEASAIYQKHGCEILKVPPYAQGGGQCSGMFFEMSMGIR